MDSILLNLQVTTLLCMQGGASGARVTLTQTYTTLVGHTQAYSMSLCVVHFGYRFLILLQTIQHIVQ